ncbi:hypothetical protein [Halomarina rubra]|uniref:Uncharacterized protein n=1 Tax=Halomarina rubra TaxID=2071873 RepID=A0ABD6AUE5_9EURY|nr:hypothetical protein [Halomarina rubra]
MAPTRRRVLRTVFAGTATVATATLAGCVESEGLPETSGPATSALETGMSPDGTSTPRRPTTTPTETSATESPGTGTDAPPGTMADPNEVSYDHHVAIDNQYDSEQTVDVRIEGPAAGSSDETTVYHEETYTVAATSRKRVFEFSTLEAETGGDREFTVYAAHDDETAYDTVRTTVCYIGVTFAIGPDYDFRVRSGIC